MSDFFICPVCGAEVPESALSCPECGSDDQTGWSEDTIYDGIDWPDEEEARPASLLRRPAALFWIALLLLMLFLFFYLR